MSMPKTPDEIATPDGVSGDSFEHPGLAFAERLDVLVQRLREETPLEDEFYAETMALAEVLVAAATAVREGIGYQQGSTLLRRVLAWANLLDALDADEPAGDLS